jgi:hypothetical protein
MRRLAATLILLSTLAVTATVFELRGRVPFKSDQALSALMALDILELGIHPVFYYGALYGGTVEPHILAAVFRFAPAGVVTYRVVMAAILAAFALVTWRTTQRAFGRTAGIAAGLYVAAGPSFLLYKGLTSDGAYVSLLLASGIAIHCLLAATEALAEGRDARLALALFGFFAGLAFWIHIPAAFLAPVLVVAVALGPWRRWLEARSLATVVFGVLLGASPWLVTNLKWGFSSLRASEAAPASIESFSVQTVALLRDGWPILLGGRSAWREEASFAGAEAATTALLAALLLAGVVTALRDAEGRRRRAAAVAVATIASVSLLTLAMARTDFREPRYLLCGYVGIAPLVGLLTDLAFRHWRALGVTVCALVLALNLTSQWTAPELDHQDQSKVDWGAYRLDGVIAGLDSLGIRSVYSSYRTAYRLAFLTNRRILSTPFGSGSDGTTRHLRLCEAVRSTPDHALLLYGEDLASTLRYLDARGIARDESRVGPFTLIRGLSADPDLRFSWCSPSDVAAHRFASVEVRLDHFPNEVPEGSRVETEVLISNTSNLWLEPTTRLSYRWLTSSGIGHVQSGPRTELRTVPGPRSTVALPLTVTTELPPGTYTLVVDLVVEHVTWYGDQGGTPFRRIVHISRGADR